MSASFSTAWLLATLLCCPASLWAQAAAKPAAPAPGKITSFGDAKAGGKLLTRNELRECLKEQTALGERRPKVEAERDAVQRELDEMKQLDQALKADAAAVEAIKGSVASLNERNQELSRKIADFNERVAKSQESPRSGPTAERQRANFETERVTLDKSAQELNAERSAFTLKAEQTLKVYNARVIARDKAAGEWNAKNAQSAKVVQAYETDRETWAADCSGRPYREDDEIAIKSGK